MRPNVRIEGDAIVSLKHLAKGFSKSMENAFKLVGFKLKKEMEADIKSDRMSWAKPSPLTLEMRKRYKRKPIAGLYFARFVRYRVDKGTNGFSLRVGVIDPKKGKPLSRGIHATSERFVKGWSYTLKKEDIKKRIKAYLKAKGKNWDSLSPRQKKNLREKMKKLGVIAKPGKVVKAPPRPVEPFLRKRENEIKRDLTQLYKRKLKGEKIPANWWQR